MISVRINGEERTFDEEPTVAAVLRDLDVPTGAIAVEVNRAVVPRAQHEVRVLRDGDEVEVLTFVGGG